MKESRLRSALREGYFRLLHLMRQPSYALRRCRVSFSSRIEPGCRLVSSTVGRYSYLGAGVYLHTTKLGNYCSVAAGTKIGGMEHSWWWGSTSPRISPHNLDGRLTLIEDDVWIGSNAVIRQGLSIGRGAVIGAGTVVLKDVSPYSIVAGVPAREIRKRFPDEIAAQVQATRFWEHRPEEARRLLGTIDFPDIDSP
jgi:acetyltransferase-like isoleucine patch superfamily enzyme